MKIKKTLLLEEGNFSLFDFRLIGVSCHLKDYRLAWGLNKSLGISLEKNELSVDDSLNENNLSRSVFSYENEFGTKFHLLKNRSQTYLAKNMPHVDYFIKIDGVEEDFDGIFKKIRDTKGVLAIFRLNVNGLKEKENFIF